MKYLGVFGAKSKKNDHLYLKECAFVYLDRTKYIIKIIGTNNVI